MDKFSMMANTKPNLIIPGAPRAGTSSLCEYLMQHNDIYFPKIKEPRYFIADIINSLPKTDPLRKFLSKYSVLHASQYYQLYRSSKTIQGDASVQYLYYHELVIPKIKKEIGDPKILILLRNPIERAYSNYMYMHYSDKKSFAEEIEMEQSKIKMGWNSFLMYVSQGFYYEQVRSYKAAFSKVKVVLFDDFNKNLSYVLKDIFQFLEVDEVLLQNVSVHNKSGVPKNSILKWLIFQDNIVKKAARKAVSPFVSDTSIKRLMLNLKNKSVKKAGNEDVEECFASLRKIYKQDILRLEELIDKDLSKWYE